MLAGIGVRVGSVVLLGRGRRMSLGPVFPTVFGLRSYAERAPKEEKKR